MEAYLNSFISLVDGAKLSILCAMIMANVLLGIAVSIKSKTFRLKELADFMASRVLPYLLGYFAVGILAVVESNWAPAVNITWGVIVLALAGAILANLKEIGINLPDTIGGDRLKE